MSNLADWQMRAHTAANNPTFVIAFDCGHHTEITTHVTYGIAWCATCRNYVGVILHRSSP